MNVEILEQVKFKDLQASISSQLSINAQKILWLILDPTLVAYSTRHTIKDKMRTIRATTELQHSILGHGKSTDADNYGYGEPLRHLFEVLMEASTLSLWVAKKMFSQ